MKVFSFLCLCLFYDYSLSSERFIRKENNYKNLADAVYDVVNEIFSDGYAAINVMLTNKNSKNVMDFTSEFFRIIDKHPKVPTRYESIDKLGQVNRRRRFNIFVAGSFDDFMRIYNRMTSALFWFNGYYLIVFVDGEIPELKEVWRLLWKIQIYNANAIFYKNDENILVKTFMPFTKKNCHNTSPLLVNEFKNKKFSKSVKDFFPNKFGNLHGCEIRAAISDESEPAVFVAHTKHNKLKVSGRDIRLLQGLSEVMKFSLNFTYVGHSGYFFANGTSKGPLKALLNKEADLSISDWYLKEHRAAFFQNSVPYFSEKLVFVVPPGKPLSPIEKLIYPMTLHAWILLLTCYSFGLVVIFVVGRSSIKYQHFVFGRDKQKPYLNMFAAFIGVSDHALPKRTFARFLLMMFLIFSLVIRSFYQGSFYQLLKSNKHHLKVQTIDEMIKKDFTFYVYSGLSDLFQGTEGIKRRLVKISIEEEISYANRILNNPEFLGALGDSMTMIAFHNQKMSEDFRYLICHDVVLIAPIVMYTLKDFYLLNEINSNIDVFTAAGLVDLWHYRDIDKQALKIKSIDNPKVLSLIQLTGCFQVLIFGYSISLIIFMGEILLRSFSNTILINYMEA